ncbi:glutamate racemase [Caviibacter abscessus]|uniref:glutamate racemase n=1 Tax=Caviibacter abscessus TaxID=1766719 RepID=UPI00083373E5|nr:glutamate racemase [Caviibacter abscessus]
MAIGIFDSGLGGLSVLKQIKLLYPNEKVIYFADSIHLPYGEKTDNQIIQYSKNICEFLISKGASSIVIACNTASSVAYDKLIKIYKIPIYSVIIPVVKYMLSNNYTKVGLIATRSTVESGKYDKLLNGKLNMKKATPKLVEYAEKLDKIGIEKVIKNYLDDMVNENEAIILGCTHFPLLNKYLKNIYNDYEFIDPALECAKSIRIIEHDSGIDEYYTSGDVGQFKTLSKNILGVDINVRVHKW